MSKGKASTVDTGKRLNIDTEPNVPDATLIARAALRPTVNAAVTARVFLSNLHSDLDLSELVTELSNQCAKASGGDLSRAEGMLTAQSHTLDAMFGSLARRAHANLREYPDAAERYMRLALKAQSQCRATLETLATIKNPPVVIARQANISNGPQQVNYGEPTRTREIQTEPSKLLEQTDGERLDTGAASEAIGSDPAMATVGAVHRPKNG